MSLFDGVAVREQATKELRSMVSSLKNLQEKLDHSGERCDSCGHQHARNWKEKRAHDTLSGARGRLQRVVQDIADWDEGD